MRKFRWPWRAGVLDAAGKEIVRSKLSEVDYEIKQIMSDVARVSMTNDRHPRANPSPKASSGRRDPVK